MLLLVRSYYTLKIKISKFLTNLKSVKKRIINKIRGCLQLVSLNFNDVRDWKSKNYFQECGLSKYSCNMMVAAISSTRFLFCRSFFFMPLCTILWLAILEVKRSSTFMIGIEGKTFLKRLIKAKKFHPFYGKPGAGDLKS